MTSPTADYAASDSQISRGEWGDVSIYGLLILREKYCAVPTAVSATTRHNNSLHCTHTGTGMTALVGAKQATWRLILILIKYKPVGENAILNQPNISCVNIGINEVWIGYGFLVQMYNGKPSISQTFLPEVHFWWNSAQTHISIHTHHLYWLIHDIIFRQLSDTDSYPTTWKKIIEGYLSSWLDQRTSQQ